MTTSNIPQKELEQRLAEWDGDKAFFDAWHAYLELLYNLAKGSIVISARWERNAS